MDRTPEQIEEVMKLCHEIFADIEKALETALGRGIIDEDERKQILFNMRRELGIPQ